MKAQSHQLFDGANALKAKHDMIGDVRGGHGLMTAFEMVSNRQTKMLIDPEKA